MDLSNELSELQTEEQVKNWLMELVAGVEQLRIQCDYAVLVTEQRQRFVAWMMRWGECLGVLKAAKRFGKLSDQAYMEMRERILNTQKPTVRSDILSK